MALAVLIQANRPMLPLRYGTCRRFNNRVIKCAEVLKYDCDYLHVWLAKGDAFTCGTPTASKDRPEKSERFQPHSCPISATP